MIRDELIREIREVAEELGEVKIMEVCGGHTNTIMRYGIRDLLPGNVKLISGPGCPVCVTSQRDIDCMIELARSGERIATYGDMANVPGTRMTLQDARAEGADILTVYSIDQILDESDRIFFGIGFETTTPMTAHLLRHGVRVFSAHKVIPPAMRILSDEMKLDGFIDPGHVSAILGSDVWETLDIGVPQVIAGFQPDQLVHATLLLLRAIRDGEKGVVNDYPEVVPPSGNPVALELMESTLKPADTEWRGMGVIPDSGLVPRDETLDARLIFADRFRDIESSENSACRCGEIVKGLIEPRECPLFGTVCTPESPQGACMVSETEGACGIAYKYGRSLSETS